MLPLTHCRGKVCTVPKASIYFPTYLLEEIDRRATESDMPRSEFVQEAAASYIAGLVAVTEQEERRESMTNAAESIRELAEEMQLPSGTFDAVRRLRDAPPRWLDGEDG